MDRMCVLRSVIDLPADQSNNSNNGSQSAEEEEEEEEGGGVDSSEEALIQAFGETAVQSVTWLVNVMGLNVNQSNNTSAAATPAPANTAASNQAPDQQQPPAAAPQPAPAKVWVGHRLPALPTRPQTRGTGTEPKRTGSGMAFETPGIDTKTGIFVQWKLGTWKITLVCNLEDWNKKKILWLFFFK